MEVSDLCVKQVRAFNRFYTSRIGILTDSVHGSPYSLTEVRVLYEICYRPEPTAGTIGKDLGIDAGYMSRILRRFEQLGFVARTPSPQDARQSHLKLTEKGREVFGELDERTNVEVRRMLSTLPPNDLEQLTGSMGAIRAALGEGSQTFTLRGHRPGDIGWVVSRHGALYAPTYNEKFEALVAEIGAKFLNEFDPTCERCWIAERDGQPIGSIFLVRGDEEGVAKLRLLLVEPSARGMGVGGRLVDECIKFAREVGYKKITLWTQSDLVAARRIYERAGFRYIDERTHTMFGPPLVAETWDLDL